MILSSFLAKIWAQFASITWSAPCCNHMWMHSAEITWSALRWHHMRRQFNAEMHLFGLRGHRIFVDCPHAEITCGRNLHKSHETQLAAITCGRHWLESHEAHRAEITWERTALHVIKASLYRQRIRSTFWTFTQHTDMPPFFSWNCNALEL